MHTKIVISLIMFLGLTVVLRIVHSFLKKLNWISLSEIYFCDMWCNVCVFECVCVCVCFCVYIGEIFIIAYAL
jgi:hypothetical protein